MEANQNWVYDPHTDLYDQLVKSHPKMKKGWCARCAGDEEQLKKGYARFDQGKQQWLGETYDRFCVKCEGEQSYLDQAKAYASSFGKQWTGFGKDRAQDRVTAEENKIKAAAAASVTTLIKFEPSDNCAALTSITCMVELFVPVWIPPVPPTQAKAPSVSPPAVNS